MKASLSASLALAAEPPIIWGLALLFPAPDQAGSDEVVNMHTVNLGKSKSGGPDPPVAKKGWRKASRKR